MGGKVADGVEEPVGVFPHVAEIRSVEVPPLHVLSDAGNIFPVDLRGLIVHGQKLIDVLEHLLVGELYLGSRENSMPS